jgi:hypothetical protein
MAFYLCEQDDLEHATTEAEAVSARDNMRYGPRR